MRSNLEWNNLRNPAKANMHKEDFRIKPYCLWYKDTDKRAIHSFFQLFKAVATYFFMYICAS